MTLDAERHTRCPGNRGCLGVGLECWASCVSPTYPKSMQTNRRKFRNVYVHPACLRGPRIRWHKNAIRVWRKSRAYSAFRVLSTHRESRVHVGWADAGSPTDSTLVRKTRLRSLRVLHPTRASRTESAPSGRSQPATFVLRYSGVYDVGLPASAQPTGPFLNRV